MKIKANLLYKPSNFQMDECQIEKVVEVSREEFSALTVTPLMDQPFIAENKGHMYARDGVVHCLLALGQGSDDGVLICSHGYDYARSAAYVPGMRDILNARLDRTADFIVRQGTENTEDGTWHAGFKELEEQLGMTVRDGNGLNTMLLDTLLHRREVVGAVLSGDGIDAVYRLDLCPKCPGHAEWQESMPGMTMR